MLGTCLERVRQTAPLIHNITNYVTVNDVANVLLACGASPIMSDDIQEVEDIAALCSGLNLNIGTLNQHTIPSMVAAGKTAAALGRPVVLDPVGAGASSLRTRTAQILLQGIPFTAVRGNRSELKSLTAGLSTTRGVDADLADAVTEDTLPAGIAFAKSAAAQLGAIVAVTGAIDLVSNGTICYVIRNGRPEMSRVTGTGCQLSALTAAYLASNPDHALEAVAAAVASMGLAGEIGWANMAPTDGNATYRSRIIDAISHLDGDTLDKGARYEIC
ncbi:MAG: hydroxyethylthiazole kinase [Lawsonibacter sp.]